MPNLRETVFETQAAPVGIRDTEDLEDYGFKRQDTVILHQTGQVMKWKWMKSLITNLPTDSYWNHLIIVSCLVNFYCGTICFFFARTYLMSFIPVYVICDLVYLFHVIVLSFHRYWKNLSKISYTVRVPMSYYILDIISLLPQELIAVAIFGSRSKVSVSLRWITYVRLRHLIHFIQSLSQLLNNRWRTFVTAFFTCMCVIQHLSTCFIYEASCHHLRCIDRDYLMDIERIRGSNITNSTLDEKSLMLKHALNSTKNIDWYNKTKSFERTIGRSRTPFKTSKGNETLKRIQNSIRAKTHQSSKKNTIKSFRNDTKTNKSRKFKNSFNLPAKNKTIHSSKKNPQHRLANSTRKLEQPKSKSNASFDHSNKNKTLKQQQNTTKTVNKYIHLSQKNKSHGLDNDNRKLEKTKTKLNTSLDLSKRNETLKHRQNKTLNKTIQSSQKNNSHGLDNDHRKLKEAKSKFNTSFDDSKRNETLKHLQNITENAKKTIYSNKKNSSHGLTHDTRKLEESQSKFNNSFDDSKRNETLKHLQNITENAKKTIYSNEKNSSHGLTHDTRKLEESQSKFNNSFDDSKRNETLKHQQNITENAHKIIYSNKKNYSHGLAHDTRKLEEPQSKFNISFDHSKENKTLKDQQNTIQTVKEYIQSIPKKNLHGLTRDNRKIEEPKNKFNTSLDFSKNETLNHQQNKTENVNKTIQTSENPFHGLDNDTTQLEEPKSKSNAFFNHSKTNETLNHQQHTIEDLNKTIHSSKMNPLHGLVHNTKKLEEPKSKFNTSFDHSKNNETLKQQRNTTEYLNETIHSSEKNSLQTRELEEPESKLNSSSDHSKMNETLKHQQNTTEDLNDTIYSNEKNSLHGFDYVSRKLEKPKNELNAPFDNSKINETLEHLQNENGGINRTVRSAKGNTFKRSHIPKLEETNNWFDSLARKESLGQISETLQLNNNQNSEGSKSKFNVFMNPSGQGQTGTLSLSQENTPYGKKGYTESVEKSLEQSDNSEHAFNENKIFVASQKKSAPWYEGRWSEKVIKKYPYYREASTWDWYLLSTFAIIEVILHNGSGNIEPGNPREMAGITLVMILGHIFFSVWFLSICFHMLTIMRRNRADYLFKIDSIKCYLRGVNVDKHVMNTIAEYYNILWMKKDGIKTAGHFETLPPPLQMEMMYDINCAHLHRSLLLFDLKEFYLRTLSLFMKHEFLLPGDILFYQGVVKTSMVVIIKGILEILSDEDDESPIIAFQAGTVLGESCLFLSLPSKATVRAAVYTEVKLIDRVDFTRTLSNYPIALSFLRERINYRIKTTKRNIVRLQDPEDIEDHESKHLIPIKQFKDRLMERQKKAAQKDKYRKSSSFLDTSGSSKFSFNILALYQLSSEDSNIETPVICLTYHFPWIIDSTSSLIKFWEHLVITVHLIFLFLYAYQVVFLRQLDELVFGLRFFSDVLCVLDVALMTTTSVVLKDHVLQTFQEIIRYRMKSIDFYINAIPVFPYEYFMLAVDDVGSEHYARIYDLLMAIKLLRLRRCYILLRRIEDYYSQNNPVFKLFSTIIYFCTVTYFSGCMLYIQSCLYEVCSEDSWFYRIMLRAVENKEQDPCYLYPFATSMYLSINLWMALGLGDIKAVLPNDLYIFTVYMVGGLLIMTYLMSSLAATMYIMNSNSEFFQQEVFSFQRFLEKNKVNWELRQEVKRYFNLRWSYDKGIGKMQFKIMAPVHLQMVVLKVDLMELLENVPLFQIIDVDFLMDIILSCNVTILPEGATVCYAGDVDRDMFILKKGCCTVHDFKGVFIRNIQAGDFYGDIEMLFNMSKCNTVRTTTNCKLVQITFRTLMSTMSMFPGEMALVQKVINNPDFQKLVEAIELKKMISFLEKVEVKIVKKRKRVVFLEKLKASFIFAGNCYKRTGGKEKYWNPFRMMGKWQLLGLLLIPITIHPEAWILKLWIIMRFILLVSMGICFPMALGLPPSGPIVQMIITLVEYTAYLELYLFLHVAYYNSDGLLITHPKLTAIHYFSHGFVMDLIAALPYYAIMPWLSYDKDNLDPTVAHLVSHKTYCMWRTLSLLQYHRVIGFISYLQSDVLARKNIYSFMIILPLVLLTLLIGTTVIINDCRYTFFTMEMEEYKTLSTVILTEPDKSTTYYGYLLCKNGSWLSYVHHHQVSRPMLVVTLAFYWFLNIFSQVGLGDITPNNDFGMYCSMLIAFTALWTFAYILAFLSSQTGRSYILALDYQEKIQELLHFLNKEGVVEGKINKIFRYFEYVWKRTTGMQRKEALVDLNSALKGDIALLMYEKTLREVSIFRRIARPYLRIIATNLKEEYFLRNDVLIKCYDVHNSVYIILRGSVNVMTPYDEFITSIGIGGIFGNLQQSAPGCSTDTFIAERNVDALKISSEMFYLIAQEYPAVRKVLDKGLKNVGDYIVPAHKHRVASEESFSYDSSYDDEIEIMSRTYALNIDRPVLRDEPSLPRIAAPAAQAAPVAPVAAGAPGAPAAPTTPEVVKVKIPKNKCLVCLLFLKPKYWFKFALEPDHVIFQYVWYTTFFATCYQMFMIPYMFASQNFNPYIFYTTLCFEPVFYIRIFFFMHEAYLDNYGTYVKKFRFIIRHYFRDYKRVMWDIIPNLPVYLLFILVEPKNQMFAFTCLRLFHLLRWRYVFQAFAVWSAPLMAKRAPILITKMIVVFLMMVHYFALTALFIFSDFGDFSKSSREYFKHTKPFESYIVCLYFITSIISTTGVGDIIPENNIELIFTICVMICTKTAYCALIVCFLMGIRILSQHIMNYEHKVLRMKKFLQNQGLSDYLLEKLWIYIKQMWNRENGLHMPELLEKAPYVMKCEIMREIYSVHLRNGYLFKDINEALLTQICGHLRRVVFFKGNYIVQNGDTNASMYWIHRGQVSVLTVHANLTETQHEILNVHDMFGLAQGLNYGMSHKYSYRAETQCDILVLNLETWECVLQQFPHDKEIIYKRMMNTYTLL
ncbi:uncharacterized protein LOC123673033 [Harmonia axyridis]|uniref:uncharacterized protein LOC123673033 n=1 Tax=Harmonia axyridis TaxID=115357 RepID=UPI001E276150|nr:uncharacterized protein LOC123673033 [Harmonia axyridis]